MKRLLTITAIVALGALTACSPLDAPVVFDRQEAPVPATDNVLPGVEAGNEQPCLPRDEFGGNCTNDEPCIPRDEYGGACLPPTPTTAPPACIPRDEFGGQCDPTLTDEELARGGN